MALRINIITTIPFFERQLPVKGFDGYQFYFNSRENIIWDMIVVYENIGDSFTFRCKEGGVVFISGEPPIVKSYAKSYIKQFDQIISSHPQLDRLKNHLEQQALPWYFGYNFDQEKSFYTFEDLEQLEYPAKNKKISFITSNRDFLPGHINRMRLLELLQKNYSDHIDFFGKGIKPIGDKAEGLLAYPFSLCIENCSIDNYWTEKIADAFLSYSVPIYCGCSNIDSYFHPDSYIKIDIKHPKSVFQILDHIIEDPKKHYDSHLIALKESRKKLLYQYNLFPTIISLYERFIEGQQPEEIKQITINPYDFYKKDFKERILRIKRFLIKKLDEISI